MSSDPALPPRVARLLAAVDSFEILHLLRLSVERREEALALSGIAGELGLTKDEVASAVERLVLASLLVRVDGAHVRYAPGSPEVGEAAEELLRIYRDDALPVVRAITAQALENLRSSAATTFADAFVLRRPKNPESDNG